jgi:hypothetical protein
MYLRTAARAALLWLVVAAPAARATGPMAPIDLLPEHREEKSRENDGPLSDFRLISYFFTRASVTNMIGDPAGLKGVSLGPIGLPIGSATLVSTSSAFFVDQRWIPVIEYTPFFFDGLASLRAQFEIDFMWGLAANAVQPNQGGGFSADQVNLQTKNVNVAIYPFKRQKPLAIVIGTQSVYDSVLDPATNSLFEIIKGGYKLAYLASDATGLVAYGNMGQHRFKVSLLPLHASQPDKVLGNNPALFFALLGTLDYSFSPMPGTHLGLSAWTLRDDTRGTAFAFEGLVYTGPGSPGLAGFTGGARFAIDKPNGGVSWFGANFQHNLGFNHGPLAASGFAMVNVGRYDSTSETTTNPKALDIFGLGANLELMYHYGRNAADVITLEGMYTTGDSNPGDQTYSGVVTMNVYGLPGAVWFNHKTLLLFPFSSTVNNFTGAVTDISNQGYGMTAAILTGTYDLVPHTLSLKLGSAAGWSNTTPGDALAGPDRGRFIGLEFNAELKWNIRYLMTVGLHGAYMVKGDFFNAVTRVQTNPYAVFTTFTWYGF